LLERLRQVARYAIPMEARVAVASGGDQDLLDLEGVEASHFPQDEHGAYVGSEPLDWTQAIYEVEALRPRPVQYLVFPATGTTLMDRYPELRRYLKRRCRLVASEPGTCDIFAVDRVKAPAFRPPDHLPLPPPEQLVLVYSMYAPAKFFESGLLGADCIRTILARHDMRLDGFDAILDLGCGCGRIMRHWKWLTGPELHGSDYNPYLVRWCTENLRFAEFGVNDLEPPLTYDDGRFDFVYGVSVFTHLDEELQHAWIEELKRVLRPSGVLYLTLHGRSRASELKPAEAERFRAGELVVRKPGAAGTNVCSAYHPESYVRHTLARDLELLDFAPDGAEDARQDAYLFRKPARSG
jgi:SAM-dependent methyltransferase